MFLGWIEGLRAKRFAGCWWRVLRLGPFLMMQDILGLCLTCTVRTAFLRRLLKSGRRAGLRPAPTFGPSRAWSRSSRWLVRGFQVSKAAAEPPHSKKTGGVWLRTFEQVDWRPDVSPGE